MGQNTIVWDIQKVHENEAEKFLNSGYEPFAVTSKADGDYYHFKKQQLRRISKAELEGTEQSGTIPESQL